MPAVSASTHASSASQPAHGASGARLWTGRVLTALATLFLLFDAFGKFAKPHQVTDAFMRLGLSLSLSVGIGVILLGLHSALRHSANHGIWRPPPHRLSRWSGLHPMARRKPAV